MWDAPLLGIDFSGSADQWKAKKRTSSVWIAAAHPDAAGMHVSALLPVQRLDGVEPPFMRLSRLLAMSTGHVGIDAPFAIPRGFGPPPPALWLELDHQSEPKRPFASGRSLLRLAFGEVIPTSGPELKPYGKKYLRATEQTWARGAATRSTLWDGPRGGAAFAVAAMTMLARHPGPIWPFREGGGGGTLIEAFPAAQLHHWGLSPKLYAGDKPDARDNRQTIVRHLRAERALTLSRELEDICLDHVDALDAVLCCYAALAVATGRLAGEPDDALARIEGHIAVHA